MRAFSKFLALPVLLVMGCTHQETAQNSQTSTRTPAATQLKTSATTSATLDYPKFIELMNRQQPKSVMQTLQILKDHYPDYLSYHVFVYNSFSLQGSTLQAPRAVVFGKDSKLVISFGGDEKIKGYDVIEIMHFDDQEKKFEFREIQFPQDKTALTEDEMDSTKNFALSPKNGTDQKCLMCHGTPARPNVSTYPFFPGFYGSHDDFRTTSAVDKNDSMYPELVAYKQFMSGNRNQGRYAMLPELYHQPGEPSAIETSRPNYRLTNQLNKLNGERVAREIKNDPILAPQKNKIIRAILCEDAPFAGNPLDTSKLTRPMTVAETYVFNRIENTAIGDGARNFENFGIRKISRLNLEPRLINVVAMAKLLELAKMDKMKVGNWSMPVGGDSFDIDSRNGSTTATSLKTWLLNPLLEDLAPELISRMPEGKRDEFSNPRLKPFCDTL